MFELVLVLALLIGVPILAIAVVTGSAAYVRAGAERELAAMADEAPPEVDSDETESMADGAVERDHEANTGTSDP